MTNAQVGNSILGGFNHQIWNRQAININRSKGEMFGKDRPWSIGPLWHPRSLAYGPILQEHENAPALTHLPRIFHSRFALLTLDSTWRHDVTQRQTDSQHYNVFPA